MARKTFEQSAETQALVKLFRSLKYDDRLSFEAASKAVGFRVYSTLPAYQSAKRVVERDHSIFIYAVRGYGFGRGTGEHMVESGHSMFSRMKRTANRTADRMINAVNENLPEDLHRQANDMYARARIVSATSSNTKATSNRRRRDSAQKADPFDLTAALASAGAGGLQR